MGGKAASQTSGPRKGRNEMQSVFLHGHVPGKKHFSPRECQLCWRGSGCIPQFWEPSAAGPKIPAFPSPPSWGAGRYGRWIMGRRPGKKRRRPPQGPPNQKRWVQGGRNSSSLVFFPPAFFQRKPGSRPESGGKPRRRAHPAPVQKAPKRGSRPEPGGQPRGRSGPATVQTWTTCRYRDPQDKKEEPQWKSNNSS